MENIKNNTVKFLKWSEKYTKTDMLYLVKGSFWVNANTIIVSVFSFIMSILFARYLEKEVYGTYQFLISLSSILGALTLTGMNGAVTQAVARGFENVFPRSVKVQLKFAFIPFIAGILGSIYYFYNQNITISLSLIIMAILVPLGNAFNTWGAFLNGKKEFKDSFSYGQIVNFAYYFGMILAIFIFPNSVFLIFLNFVINTLTSILVYKLVINKYKPNSSYEEEAISFGKKFSVSSILPMLALNIDNVAVFHFLGAKELAIYAFASNLPERLGSLLRPISILAFPKFSSQTKEDINKSINHKIKQILALATIGGIFYFLLSPLIFRLFFPQYLESIIYSQIYAIVVIIGTAGNLVFTALTSTRSKNIFKFNFVNPIFNIVVIYTMIYFFGIWGAITGKILSNIFFLGISRYYLQKND